MNKVIDIDTDKITLIELVTGLKPNDEVVIVKDHKPVAKLVRFAAPAAVRTRFDPVAHAAWQRRMSGGTVTRWVDEGLLAERDER